MLHCQEGFGDRWIGMSGPTAWPARSLDLPRFLLWGWKSMVYDTDIDSEEVLVACIVSAAAEVRKIPGIFGRVRQSMARRCTVWMSMDVYSSTWL